MTVLSTHSTDSVLLTRGVGSWLFVSAAVGACALMAVGPGALGEASLVAAVALVSLHHAVRFACALALRGQLPLARPDGFEVAEQGLASSLATRLAQSHRAFLGAVDASGAGARVASLAIAGGGFVVLLHVAIVAAFVASEGRPDPRLAGLSFGDTLRLWLPFAFATFALEHATLVAARPDLEVARAAWRKGVAAMASWPVDVVAAGLALAHRSPGPDAPASAWIAPHGFVAFGLASAVAICGWPPTNALALFVAGVVSLELAVVVRLARERRAGRAVRAPGAASTRSPGEDLSLR